MCVSFWYEAYSIIKLSSAGSFSELANFVFNCISPARVCSTFLPWFPRDTKACCGAENRETLGRGREKAPMGPWWMPVLLPLYHLSPKGCSTSFALGKPLTNVCLKRLGGLENRKEGHLNSGKPSRAAGATIQGEDGGRGLALFTEPQPNATRGPVSPTKSVLLDPFCLPRGSRA